MNDWNPDAVPDAPPPSRLTSDERAVLGALILPPASPVSARTPEAAARRAGMELPDFEATFRKLMGMDPVPVHSDRDAKTGEEVLTADNEAIELLDPPPPDAN